MTNRRALKVGLSAVAVQEDVVGSFWTNGMTQNLIYLALLLQRIPVADRDGSVLHRFTIDREAEWRPHLVLTPVTPADRPRFVIEDGEVRP